VPPWLASCDAVLNASVARCHAGRTKEAEQARVDKELANIRRQFTTSKV
jgi:hypothetical protein